MSAVRDESSGEATALDLFMASVLGDVIDGTVVVKPAAEKDEPE